MNHHTNILKYKRLGIASQQEHIAFMRFDCDVCISEGFEALSRIRVWNGAKSIVASLDIIHSNILAVGEIGLSESAAKQLNVNEGDSLTVSHLISFDSLSFLRAKIYGKRLPAHAMKMIIADIVNGNYSNIHLSAFITACAGENLDADEVISLTKAMIETGEKLEWQHQPIMDKHCIGGLPGNRTTPIIVSIIAAYGLTMPKTSSRAITSPAGTVDVMQVMAPVNLSMEQIKSVVGKEGGCIAMGGTAGLSPADEILIRVERALDIDSEGQLIASVLSKKAAAGCTHAIIDMPVGETAKLRSIDAANRLKVKMEKVAHTIGIKLKVIITDGSQPVGCGIGPALEAMDILAVLRNQADAPQDLKERALLLAGELLELSGKVEQGEGNNVAAKILESGEAYKKFLAICAAQGSFTEPRYAQFKHDVKAANAGTITNIDNRKLARVAKLAGAPDDPLAGIRFFAPMGKKIETGEVLYTIYADTEGQLGYALEYVETQDSSIIVIQ